MPSLQITENHQLATPEALKRIQHLLADLQQTHSDKISDVQQQWVGPQATFSFRIMGFRLEGQIQVTSEQVTLLGKIPFGAVPFRGIAERAIRNEARKLLDA